MFGNTAAKGEYATAPISVWWDMYDCPIPEDYDATRFRPSLEEAFKKLGYTGPVSITGYADLVETPDRLLRPLTSTGVNVAHSFPGNICSFMFDDILEWRAHNRPPATMMLISNRVEHVLSWDLARLQQETYYNLVRAYSVEPFYSSLSSLLRSSAEWLWDNLLVSPDKKPKSALVSAIFHCKLCSLDCQTLKTFRKHLSNRKHILKEVRNPEYRQLDPVTRTWGRNYEPTSPEYAKAKIRVWWNMEDCPIPKGYDARQVRPSIEEAFRSLGYTGPVSIIAFGDHKLTPDHVLQVLSSTGIDVAHSIPEKTTTLLFNDMLRWRRDNPPPATIMIIANDVDIDYSHCLVRLQQPAEYKFCLAYSYRPCKLSVLVTSAEWLWDSLFAGLCCELCRCPLVEKCSGESGKSTAGMFYCKLCYCDCNGLDDFRKHLASDVHLREVRHFLSNMRYSQHQKDLAIEMETYEKSFEIIPEGVSPYLWKASSQTDATQEKKNVVASSLNAASPPFYPSSSSNLPQKNLQASMGRRVNENSLQPSGRGSFICGETRFVGAAGSMVAGHDNPNFPAFLPVMQFGSQHGGVSPFGMAFPQPQHGGVSPFGMVFPGYVQPVLTWPGYQLTGPGALGASYSAYSLPSSMGWDPRS